MPQQSPYDLLDGEKKITFHCLTPVQMVELADSYLQTLEQELFGAILRLAEYRALLRLAAAYEDEQDKAAKIARDISIQEKVIAEFTTRIDAIRSQAFYALEKGKGDGQLLPAGR